MTLDEYKDMGAKPGICSYEYAYDYGTMLSWSTSIDSGICKKDSSLIPLKECSVDEYQEFSRINKYIEKIMIEKQKLKSIQDDF